MLRLHRDGLVMRPRWSPTATRLRSQLGWQPEHDDLDGIVRSALVWERRQLS